MTAILSGNYAPLDEMHRLVASSLAGNMSHEEKDRLEELVRQDVESRSLYLDVIHETSILLTWAMCGRPNGDVLRQATADPEKTDRHRVTSALIANSPAPTFPTSLFHPTLGFFSSGWPVAYLVATVIFGIGLVIGAIVHVPDPVQLAVQSPTVTKGPLSPEPKMAFVGRITGMVDCQWADPNTAPVGPVAVPLGHRYALASGLMEITYNTGAKVILQGPVTYVVESRNGGFLPVGKLTGKVENETANGFSVRTPTATVTDLGTEFGVEVRKSGATAAHVFRGVVELQPLAQASLHARAIRMVANESAQVDFTSGGKELIVRRGAADTAAFVRADQLPKLIADADSRTRLTAFCRWQAYSRELRRDPSLLAYYDFQPKEGSPSVLPNVAGKADGSLDGIIENARWTSGRMTGKQSLHFQGPNDRVRINLPHKVDDLTLAAWLYVERLDNNLSGLVMSDGWSSEGGIGWQLDSNAGAVGFGVFGWQSPYLSASTLGLCYRRWVHCVMVYDRNAARASVYVNGELQGDVPVPRHVPIQIGSAEIGNWDPAGWHTMPNRDEAAEIRYFHGWIDELAIFGRPLKSDEIQRMVEAGRPAERDIRGGNHEIPGR